MSKGQAGRLWPQAQKRYTFGRLVPGIPGPVLRLHSRPRGVHISGVQRGRSIAGERCSQRPLVVTLALTLQGVSQM